MRDVDLVKSRGGQGVQEILTTKLVTSFEDLLLLSLIQEGVGAIGDEGLDNVSVATFTRGQERRKPVVPLGFETSPVHDEQTNDGRMTVLRGDDERSRWNPKCVDGCLVVE